ncbi:P-loop containing nucleoside triphosphate hydrolase protein [Crepidotus variabilis]|uniref:P-loop containing nucleoside triphosphate hydrolase protein n=1 Tax=Crepidotus variabilis TaxID=179855 RepID=A0A9P6EPI9_9AGAR|nr:P-loop containing nucleoside triphosphate hydrolase protein [Crepidotus variabilis]
METQIPSVEKIKIQPEDVVIAVIGPTGAGKSTFVQLATNADVGISHKLPSCTESIRVFQVPFSSPQDKRIFVIDTPGFDGSSLSDAKLLEQMARWLAKTYDNQIKLSGLLYFHRISDNRMSGSSLKSLKIVEKLSGDKFKSVVLVTTMWDEVDEKVGEQRERELETIYWKPLMKRGSTTHRFSGTSDSALDILRPIIENSTTPLALLLQEEIQNGLGLHQTKAASGLELEYSAIAQEHAALCTKIQVALRGPTTLDDDQLRKWMSQCRRLHAKVLEAQAKATASKPPGLWGRLQGKFKSRQVPPSTNGPEIRFEDITLDDRVILVLSQTGAGKSSFICDCSGYDRRNIGHSLESSTKEIKIVRAPVEPGEDGLVFVDTPGFDNSDQIGFTDAVIQQKISDLCYAFQKKGIIPKGVLYLFDMSNNLRPESYSAIWALYKFSMPENLVIATTMWDQADDSDRKESHLREERWSSMINAGALMERIWESERPIVTRRIVDMLTRDSDGSQL